MFQLSAFLLLAGWALKGGLQGPPRDASHHVALLGAEHTQGHAPGTPAESMFPAIQRSSGGEGGRLPCRLKPGLHSFRKS